MITVPLWLALILFVVGGIFWVSEKVQQAKRASARRQASRQLREETSNQPAATQMPYGFGNSPNVGGSELSETEAPDVE